MKRFYRKLFSSEKKVVSGSIDSELKKLNTFLDKFRSADFWNDSLEDKFDQLSRMKPGGQIQKLPGYYLLFENYFSTNETNPTKARERLRKQFRLDFPKIAETTAFKIIFLDTNGQGLELSQLFMVHIWKRVRNAGNFPDDRLQNYRYQVDKAFTQFFHGHLSRTALQSTLKYEVTQIYEALLARFEKSKVQDWFQDAYNLLAGNYKFLESFNFLVALLPENVLNEQQLSLLSRAQIEGVLIEKTQKLEEINARLLDEIGEKEHLQRASKEGADRVNKIIENAMDAVVLMNEFGQITFWNSQAQKIFGWSAEEMVGIEFTDRIIPKSRRKPFKEAIGLPLKQKNATILNKRLEEDGMTKEGHVIPLELSIIANIVGKDVIFTSFIRDISERKRYEKELMDAKEHAEKASKSKAEFLSTMSHEIRTPMNGLSGTIEYLLTQNPRSDQIESLKLMKHSAQNLLVILNDILDLSKIEEGHIEFDSRAFSMNELSKRIISTYIPRAEEKRIHLFLQNDISDRGELIGDPVRLSQILNNLISNAIKFTQEGHVELRIERIADDPTSCVFRFQVLDTGIGIPKDKLRMIFERFTQVHRVEKESLSGTGLGLSIAKKLLELQGSDLQVDSTEGEGSRFFFELELLKNLKTLEPDHQETQVAKDLTGLKILLVEDNKINQIVAAKFLSRWNCTVDFAENGEIAIKMVKSRKYDVVLMDLQMPKVDGFEASRRIRNMAGNYFRYLPIIALSADVFHEVRRKANAAGMNGFLSKPFDPNNLYQTIVESLQIKQLK